MEKLSELLHGSGCNAVVPAPPSDVQYDLILDALGIARFLLKADRTTRTLGALDKELALMRERGDVRSSMPLMSPPPDPSTLIAPHCWDRLRGELAIKAVDEPLALFHCPP